MIEVYIKKILSALLVCALIFSAVPLMFSCKGEDEGPVDDSYTAKQLADAIVAAYGADELPDTGLEHHFNSGADEDSDSYVDSKLAGLLIDNAYAELDEYEYFFDCAFYMPIGKRMFEVIVLKIDPENKENIGILKEVLERRIENKKRSDVLVYAPQDAPLLENAKVVTVGSYVVLLVTPDNGKAEKAINDLVRK